MKVLLVYTQIILSILLIFCILLQSKGQGFSTSFGSGELYGSKRGMEKVLFYITIGLTILFAVNSLLNLVL